MIKISLLLKRLRENFEIPIFFCTLDFFFQIKIVLLLKSLGTADVKLPEISFETGLSSEIVILATLAFPYSVPFV